MASTPQQLAAARLWRQKNPEKARESVRRWREAHREQAREATRRWVLANPEKAKEANQAYRIANPAATSRWSKRWRANNPDAHLKKYGMTLSDFISLAVKQGAKCAICETQGKLCVDHCHDSGKVRGLLCRQCNAAIGLFKDSRPIVVNAAAYLGGHSLVHG